LVSRKVIFGLAISVIALISIALVIISPAFIDDLESINSVETLNWSRLSEIGQTYGVAAAILSTLAFAGIAASLIMQADQTRSSRLHAVRVYHLELLKMATEKPELYLPVLGVHTEVDLDEARQRIYAVSQMNYFLMAYENRIVHEKSLRGEMLTDAFQSELVRD
jgi:hypothetical protein